MQVQENSNGHIPVNPRTNTGNPYKLLRLFTKCDSSNDTSLYVAVYVRQLNMAIKKGNWVFVFKIYR